jgi:hypothetical protein
MMSLVSILELTGRLTDQSGANTPRERFRRFLRSDVPGLSGVRALIVEAQASDDDQAQRALGDLVVTLGRFVGCDVTYGSYLRTPSGAQMSGTWSSPDIRIAIDICMLRNGAPVPPSSKGLEAGSVVAPGGSLWLRILVKRGRTSAGEPFTAVPAADSPLVTFERVNALAEDVERGRLTGATAIERLLHPAPTLELNSTSEDAEPDVASAPRAPAQTAARSGVEGPDHATEFWIATIVDDEGAPAELLTAKVIGERRVLPASGLGLFMPSARPGDWVCFFIAGSGVVGWARLHALVDPLAAPVRRAHRFTSIFELNSISFHAAPVPLDGASLPQRLANRSPLGVAGSFLSPISAQDFRTLTAGSMPLAVES